MGFYNEGNKVQKQSKSIFIRPVLFTLQYGLHALTYQQIILVSIHRPMTITWNYHRVRYTLDSTKNENCSRNWVLPTLLISKEGLRMYAT